MLQKNLYFTFAVISVYRFKCHHLHFCRGKWKKICQHCPNHLSQNIAILHLTVHDRLYCWKVKIVSNGNMFQVAMKSQKYTLLCNKQTNMNIAGVCHKQLSLINFLFLFFIIVSQSKKTRNSITQSLLLIIQYDFVS